jgi:hypothetical protein
MNNCIVQVVTGSIAAEESDVIVCLLDENLSCTSSSAKELDQATNGAIKRECAGAANNGPFLQGFHYPAPSNHNLKCKNLCYTIGFKQQSLVTSRSGIDA